MKLSHEDMEESQIIDSSGTSYRKKLKRQEEQKLTSFDKVSAVVLPILFCILVASVIYKAHIAEGTRQEKVQINNVEQLISSDLKIDNYHPKDYYWFSVSTRDLILNSDLDSLYRRDRKAYSIDRETHLRAILLTQLIHNVNFKGQVKVEMSPFDTDQKRKQQVIKRVIQYEKNYYNQKYNMSKYENQQLPFCIVVPSYNNVKSRLYLRNLDSLFMQDYKNYRVVYIDDHSPEKTGQFVLKYVKEKQIPNDKINVVINDVNKKALQNIYEGIHKYCKDGEIVVLIDGDDSFNGRQVLKLYNAIFHQKKAGLVYSNFLKITSNSRTEFGFGSQVTQQYFQSGYLRTYWPIVGTHLMAFYTEIFKQIKKEDLCYDNGTFYNYAYDRAIITPLLQLSFPKNTYVPEMVYQYRNDTGVNDGAREWEKVSDMIQAKPAYESLKEFPFIDENPIIKEGQKLK